MLRKFGDNQKLTSKIRETLIKFSEMMLEKEPDTQFIKIKVGLKNKKNIKFKKFREYEKQKNTN